MESIGDFLTLLGLLSAGGLVVLGAVVYLLKHVVKRWIDRAFDAKEKDIVHQNKLLEHRSQVVFSSLHVQRAETIRVTYGKLLEFKDAVLDCINKAHLDDKQGGERFALMWNLGVEVHRLVEREGIYLDEATCALILRVSYHYDQAGLSMTFGAGVPINFHEYVPKLERSREIIKNDCLVALKELQNQFRKILGVE